MIMMAPSTMIGTILGYSVSVAAGVFGIAVLTGLVNTGVMPTQFRIMFGVVLLLLSIYRAITTWMRAHQRDDNDA